MMTQARILNRVVFINIASTPYANIELSGNTCFIGSNNLGKTTLLRSILFFYSARGQRLGIAPTKKSFDKYYFQFSNSYIIYEVSGEEGLFHVLVYRNKHLFYRFVNAPFRKEYYVENNQALELSEVLSRFDKNPEIDYSPQIDTFEKYRDIIYGAERDYKFRKYSLLQGKNKKYDNIYKAITDIFLSSDTEVKADFVKDFISNSISDGTSGIKLEQIERQLNQFSQKYEDIKTFRRNDIIRKAELIIEKHHRINDIKSSTKHLAADLGSSVKYAEQQRKNLEKNIAEKQSEIDAVQNTLDNVSGRFISESKKLTKQIGAWEAKVNEARQAEKKYEKVDGLKEILDEAAKEREYRTSLEEQKKKYINLTAPLHDINERFDNLTEKLKTNYNNAIGELQTKILKLEKEKSNQQADVRDYYRKETRTLEQKEHKEVREVNEEITSARISLKEHELQAKSIKKERYFESEISELRKQKNQLTEEIKDKKRNTEINQTKITSGKDKIKNIENQYNKDLNQLRQNITSQIDEHKKRLTIVEERLSVHENALYGFLEQNVPDWKNNIGRVCKPEIIFGSELDPKVVLREYGKSLYGVSLELENLDEFSHSIEKYEQERKEIKRKISDLEQERLDEKERLFKDKQNRSAALNREIRELETEIRYNEYHIQQAERQIEKAELEIANLQEKASEKKTSELEKNNLQQENIKEQIAKFNEQIKNIKLEFDKLKQDLQKEERRKNKEIENLFLEESDKIQQKKLDKKKDYEVQSEELKKEKEKSLKSNDIDPKTIEAVSEKIDSLKAKIAKIAENDELVSEFHHNKKMLLDKLPEYKRNKKSLESELEKLETSFDSRKAEYKTKIKELESEKSYLNVDFQRHTEDLKYYHNNFTKSSIFEQYQDIIETASLKASDKKVTELSSLLYRNDVDYHREFDSFRTYINDFTGRFNIANHFNFRISENATERECIQFAKYLSDFIADKKIETSIAEVATHHGMLINTITDKVNSLTSQIGKVKALVSKMEKDFRKAEFEDSKLIEFIKVKIEKSENKILKRLKQISAFKENNLEQYDTIAFDFKDKNKLAESSVRLLYNLKDAIEDENQDEIRIQDLFKLLFKIKEGKNETDWTDKINNVGSDGTDMLVKAIIYITLLHVFINESVSSSSHNFYVHCLIDEVGKISAPYLKQLMDFANKRNIYLINGLPNESKLETYYNYTYKLMKNPNASISIRPLLTISVDA